MALFKVNRGNSSTLPATKTDGWAYFCTDTGEFFIDYVDEQGNLNRKQINAEEARKIVGYDIGTVLNNSEVEIPTSSAVFDALLGKADTSHEHNNLYYTKAEVDTLELITTDDIDDICNFIPDDPDTPDVPANTFKKVRALQGGKEYVLMFGYNGAYYCVGNSAFNNYTIRAVAINEVKATDAQITFTTVPTLFTATTSGSGFTLNNGSNSITGSASSGSTSLALNTNAGTVFTVDTSDMGGFDSDEIVAKVDDQAVWLRTTLNNKNCCLKFESANTSIGIDYKDRNATYSTGFLSFVLYEKIS